MKRNGLQKWVDTFIKVDAKTITKLYDDNTTNHQIANEPITGLYPPAENFWQGMMFIFKAMLSF
ncbi:hypothetical protein [Tangfeifania diversioriginum]|uniref:hypothetical protein n=1 Tax=Tangfeifania diversioriginum TaxID=1168035 RepID=UPI0015879268|nr:hypothetical protein [Tangfeifania diversioriginum]